MAGWLTLEPKGAQGLTPHRFYAVVTPYARKSRIGWKPETEEQLLQWIMDEGQRAADAIHNAVKEGRLSKEKEDDAAEEARRVAMIRARDSGQYEFSKFDQRASAVVELFIDDPGEDLQKRAQPYHRFEIAYDHDFNSPEDARAQAYRAVAARFPNQWEDAL